MTDPRILQYREAALAMKEGRFHLQVEPGEGDAVADLGKALLDLGKVMERRFNELHSLGRITEEINAGLLLDEVLTHVFESFQSIIPYDRIGFSLISEEGQTVRARWARSMAPEMRISEGYESPLEGSSLQAIIDTGKPRIINDLVDYAEGHSESDATRRIISEGMRSSLTCPLISKGKPIGFMFFSSMKPGTYNNVHVETFQQIAGQLAVIVEKGRLYQELLELNELKDKFLGIAAHDLRNPLAVVKGYLDVLSRGSLGEVNEQQTTVMGRMEKACEKMLALINDLLDVSAIQAGSLELAPEPVNLREFLTDLHTNASLLAQGKSIRLDLDLADDLPTISVDPKRIEQVVDNLVSNAIKFSYPETTVTLRAFRKDGEARIVVADQGQGIPKDELGKVFTEFGRTSVRPTAGEKSTGLGLAIVKKLVEVHGGRIWVESKVGVGTTFTFALPEDSR